MATVVSGKELAEKIRGQLKEKVADFKKKYGYAPGLAVILVGEDPASKVYVNNKEKACIALGMKSEVRRLPQSTTEQELLCLIDEYNKREDIHGLLVQFPLPAHLSQKAVLERIDPNKDVDGLTVANSGALASGMPGLVSCTPRGIIELDSQHRRADCWETGRGCRQKQSCWKASGTAASGRKCHGHHLPFQDEESKGNLRRGRYFGSCHGKTRISWRRVYQRRRCGN